MSFGSHDHRLLRILFGLPDGPFRLQERVFADNVDASRLSRLGTVTLSVYRALRWLLVDYPPFGSAKTRRHVFCHRLPDAVVVVSDGISQVIGHSTVKGFEPTTGGNIPALTH